MYMRFKDFANETDLSKWKRQKFDIMFYYK